MNKTICCLLLVCLVGLGGCMDNRIKLNKNIKSDLDIEKVVAERNNEGLLQVNINGENDTSKYFKSEYRIIWLDKNGTPLETILSDWTPFPVHEDAEFYITAVAPHPRATDFRIVIRRKEN